MQAKEEIINLIRERVASLSDLEIIELEAHNLGFAIFPLAHAVFANRGFVDPYWSDSVVQQYWTTNYGPGAQVYVGSGINEDLDGLAGSPAQDEDKFENALDEKIANTEWLAECARECREKMAADAALQYACDQLVDFWTETLQEAAAEQDVEVELPSIEQAV